MHNTTVDAHPIHLHLVDFRILNREQFSGTLVDKPMGAGRTTSGGYLTNVSLTDPLRPAELPSDIESGERIYRTGVLGNGAPLTGNRDGGVRYPVRQPPASAATAPAGGAGLKAIN